MLESKTFSNKGVSVITSTRGFLTVLATLLYLILTCFLVTKVLAAGTIKGLDFPGSDTVSTTMRFRFVNPQDNGLPIWGPNGRGITYIWQAYPRQQHGYYTTFFWGNDGQFWWDGSPNTYYGFHPYPQGDGTSHKWEIAGDYGGDYLGGTVTYNRWYTQVARVWSDGSGKHHEFYWDWPDTSKVITLSTGTDFGNTDPPFPALTWGDAPWPHGDSCVYGECGEGGEVYNGIIRGIQIYNNTLSLADIQKEINSPLSTSAGASNIWYLNLNPTPTDISDKSGRNDHPEWVGSERPSLYIKMPPTASLIALPPGINYLLLKQ